MAGASQVAHPLFFRPRCQRLCEPRPRAFCCMCRSGLPYGPFRGAGRPLPGCNTAGACWAGRMVPSAVGRRAGPGHGAAVGGVGHWAVHMSVMLINKRWQKCAIILYYWLTCYVGLVFADLRLLFWDKRFKFAKIVNLYKNRYAPSFTKRNAAGPVGRNAPAGGAGRHGPPGPWQEEGRRRGPGPEKRHGRHGLRQAGEKRH